MPVSPRKSGTGFQAVKAGLRTHWLRFPALHALRVFSDARNGRVGLWSSLVGSALGLDSGGQAHSKMSRVLCVCAVAHVSAGSGLARPDGKLIFVFYVRYPQGEIEGCRSN
jgi:hypothetical protein